MRGRRRGPARAGWAGACIAAVVAACVGACTSTIAPADVSPLLDAGVSADATLPAVGTATIGSAGGAVTSTDGKLTVSIPPQALPADTTITVSPVSPPPSGALGTVYEIGPTGTQFNAPVVLSFVADPSWSGMSVAAATYVDGAWQALAISNADDAGVYGITTHLSKYGVVPSPLPCSSSSQCEAPFQCVNGGCSLPCATTRDCPSFLACQAGTCRSLSCQTNSQCSALSGPRASVGGALFDVACSVLSRTCVPVPANEPSLCPVTFPLQYGCPSDTRSDCGGCYVPTCTVGATNACGSPSLDCAYGQCWERTVGCACGSAGCPCSSPTGPVDAGHPPADSGHAPTDAGTGSGVDAGVHQGGDAGATDGGGTASDGGHDTGPSASDAASGDEGGPHDGGVGAEDGGPPPGYFACGGTFCEDGEGLECIICNGAGTCEEPGLYVCLSCGGAEGIVSAGSVCCAGASTNRGAGGSFVGSENATTYCSAGNSCVSCAAINDSVPAAGASFSNTCLPSSEECIICQGENSNGGNITFAQVSVEAPAGSTCCPGLSGIPDPPYSGAFASNDGYEGGYCLPGYSCMPEGCR